MCKWSYPVATSKEISNKKEKASSLDILNTTSVFVQLSFLQFIWTYL